MILGSCKNRVKPKLLREVKTEALLVFIRTTLEDYVQKVQNKQIVFCIGSEEENTYVNELLKELLYHLQECVVSSSYLRSLIANIHKNATLKMVAKQEEPLMVYYDAIIKALEINLDSGRYWMPELVVIALLSEWVLEEEKSVYLYPFLSKIDYVGLIEIYDKAKLNLDAQKKEIIMDMYKLSSQLIKKLKETNYKVNTKYSKKRRKKQ